MSHSPPQSPPVESGRASALALPCAPSYLVPGPVPAGLYRPADLPQVRLCLASLEEGWAPLPCEYCALEGKDLVSVEDQFQLLAKCHAVLKLRESNLHQAAYLLHRLCQRAPTREPRDAAMRLCALLFICNKYEPTERRVYPLRDLVLRLFGVRTRVTPEAVADEELEVLRILDYRCEPHTPYQAAHLYGSAAGLDARQMTLALYLLTLAALSPSLQAFAPNDVAAAAVLLVLEQHRLQWSASLSYWAARRPANLVGVRAALLALWRRAHEARLQGHSHVVTARYADDRHFRVAELVPPAE